MNEPDACLAIVRTLTATRVGSGQAADIIDLPVYRDAATSWPVLPGSGMKGVLKDSPLRAAMEAHRGETDPETKAKYTEKALKSRAEQELKDVFGLAGDDGSGGIGSLVVADLWPVLFPIRSFCGVFAWVTCPLALAKLRLFARLAAPPVPPPDGASGSVEATTEAALDHPTEVGEEAGRKVAAEEAAPRPLAVPELALEAKEPPEVIVGTKSVLRCKNKVVLEEFDLVPQPAATANTDALATALAPVLGIGLSALKERLAVVDDDVFTFLTEVGTEKRTRTALEIGTKAVRAGSLRTEEYVPPETVFVGYAVIPDAYSLRTARFLQIGAEASLGAGMVEFRVGGGGRP
ncbi:MAG: type III-B CRISPR module RAMP protein Cmr4 [Fimbriimonadaceae bacterium]|nr:type III-B CRISPR module RAMP protein Cmr4 [Fimbriimonadaceae bacterium]